MAKVSVALENAFESAMFDDIEVVVTAAGLEIHHFEPNERNPEGSDVVQFKITFRSDEDKTLDQTYRLGDTKFIIITHDGASFDFAPDAKGISRKSEFYHFCTELKNAGFPVEELDEDKRGLKDGLVGGRYHIKAEVEKDSDGNVKRYTGKNNKEYDSTKIMVTKVITLPWEAKKGKAAKAATKPAAAAPAATKAAAKAEPVAEAPAGDVDVKEAVSNLVTEMVLKGPTKKQIVLAAALRKFQTNAPARIDAMKLLNNTEFLKSIDGVDFDGTTLKLAE